MEITKDKIEELSERLNKPEMVNKQEFIEKACEILDSMLYMYDGLETDIVTSRCDTVEDFINEFKKSMEE